MVQTITILAADDDPDDLALLRASFERTGSAGRLVCVRDGTEVFSYLEAAEAGKHPWPSVLLLDLKMPGMNGFDVLARLQAHAAWKKLPVIVFSGSNQPVDVERAYDLGASRYLIKPQKVSDLVQVLRSVEMFCQRLPAAPEAKPPRESPGKPPVLPAANRPG